MNHNQGLEALAALASAASAPSAASGNRTSDTINGLQNSVGGKGEQTSSNANNNNTANNSNNSAETTSAAMQQWQQAIAAAAANIAGPLAANPTINSNPLALLASLQQLSSNNQAAATSNTNLPNDSSALLSMQQKLSYLQYLAQVGGGGTLMNSSTAASLTGPASQALSMALAGRAGQSILPSFLNSQSPTGGQQQPPQPSMSSAASSSSTGSASMPPPPSVGAVASHQSQQPITVNTSGVPSPNPQHATIAPQPPRLQEHATPSPFDNDFEGPKGDKKQMKRAANRKSAQLSRKRKKQFIEELKDENDSLRRKEQILKSIPDLVVVFDSSGKLWFVSQSVSRFIDFSADELEGTSFWNRLCEDSVRLLKAAFMDSLAARQPDSDSAPLGTGFWELRLVDKDGSQQIVTLNGVVHFAGDRPECVCSIRPHDDSTALVAGKASSDLKKQASSKPSALENMHKSLIRVKPQQSVVSNDRSDSSSSSRRAGKEAIRISDSGNSSGSSGCSDSGSSDELNADVAA